jgi:hypothetical protein
MPSSSKKYRRRSRSTKRKTTSTTSRSKTCNGGRRKGSRSKTHKWHQKGCQSGGGSMTGGSPWAPSDVHPQTEGLNIPQAINGNHYALNTDIMVRPQSSNHLAETGLFSGGRRRRKLTAKERRRRHRRFIGEQHGGKAEYLPETINATVRGAVETPAMVANTLQGASTGFVTSNPTIQPIGLPVQLK